MGGFWGLYWLTLAFALVGLILYGIGRGIYLYFKHRAETSFERKMRRRLRGPF